MVYSNEGRKEKVILTGYIVDGSNELDMIRETLSRIRRDHQDKIHHIR